MDHYVTNLQARLDNVLSDFGAAALPTRRPAVETSVWGKVFWMLIGACIGVTLYYLCLEENNRTEPRARRELHDRTEEQDPGE